MKRSSGVAAYFRRSVQKQPGLWVASFLLPGAAFAVAATASSPMPVSGYDAIILASQPQLRVKSSIDLAELVHEGEAERITDAFEFQKMNTPIVLISFSLMNMVTAPTTPQFPESKYACVMRRESINDPKKEHLINSLDFKLVAPWERKTRTVAYCRPRSMALGYG